MCADTEQTTSLQLLRLYALSAGEQARRRQLKSEEEDPENKHSQASVTRRVHKAKAEWSLNQAYNDLTGSILRSLEGEYKQFFIDKHFRD